MKKLLYISSFLLIMIGVIIFKLPLFAQEGGPVRFDTASVYAYFDICAEECPQVTSPWNPMFYYYENVSTDEGHVYCAGPESGYYKPFMLNVHYIVYPHPGFIASFTDPGGDFEEFLGGINPIIPTNARLYFYEDYESKEEMYVFKEPTIWGPGLGVPLMNYDQTDPFESDLLLYSRIFPLPPPKTLKDEAPGIVGLFGDAPRPTPGETLTGYMALKIQFREMFGKTKDVQIGGRLPYRYEESDPLCRLIAQRADGLSGEMPDPRNPADNITYAFESEDAFIGSGGRPVSSGTVPPPSLTIPEGTILNPQGGGFGLSNNVDDIYLKIPQSVDIKKDVQQVSPPLGPYPVPIEPYRDDTGFHDAVATVNLKWVIKGDQMLLARIEGMVADRLECYLYPGLCSEGNKNTTQEDSQNIIDRIMQLINIPDILKRLIGLPDEEIYQAIKGMKITLDAVKLEYQLSPYSDQRCPKGFTVYSYVQHGELSGPEQIFDLVAREDTDRGKIDDIYADFYVLGTGGAVVTEKDGTTNYNDKITTMFANLHNTECEYTVTPISYHYKIDGTNYISTKPGLSFPVIVHLYN